MFNRFQNPSILEISNRCNVKVALPAPILYSSGGGLSVLNFCNFLSAQIPELGRLYYASAHSFLTGVANVENLRREFPRERRFHSPSPRVFRSRFLIVKHDCLSVSQPTMAQWNAA